MENKTAIYIMAIERILKSEKLNGEQRRTLAEFDHFNELEAQCCENTRRAFLLYVRRNLFMVLYYNIPSVTLRVIRCRG